MTIDSVNGGPSVLVDQPNTGGGHVILSIPVKLTLRNGPNALLFSANQKSMCLSDHSSSLTHFFSLAYAGDLDKIIVYPVV